MSVLQAIREYSVVVSVVVPPIITFANGTGIFLLSIFSVIVPVIVPFCAKTKEDRNIAERVVKICRFIFLSFVAAKNKHQINSKTKNIKFLQSLCGAMFEFFLFLKN